MPSAGHACEQERLFCSQRPPAGHAREQERPFRSRRPSAGHACEQERPFRSRRAPAGHAREQERLFRSRRAPAGHAREPKRLFCSRRAWHLVHIRLLTYFTGVLSWLLAAVPMNEYSLANIFVKIIRDKWELLLRKWLFLQNAFLLVDALGKKECAGGILLTAKDYLPKRFGQAGEVEQNEQVEQIEQICLTNT